MKYTKAEKAECLKNLREWIKENDTIYTILERVSRSGMQRSIKLFILKTVNGKPEIWHISHSVAVVLGLSRKPREDGVTVNGCGMDMGFHLVHSLSHALFGVNDGSLKLDYRWL